MASPESPVGPFPSGATPDDYDRLRRRVLWMLPSGLYLLGSRAGGRRNLMTLNWATQVSVAPKLVAVSVERGALTHELVEEGRAFALSLLARADRSVARRFVRPADPGPGPGELNGFVVRSASTGCPVLDRSAAWLDCELRDQLACGSHTLFVGEVVDAGGAAGAGGNAGGTGSEEIAVLRMEDTRMSYGG